MNEFLDLINEIVINKDSNIFISIVDYYSIDKPGEESESSDKGVEEVDIAEALRYIKTVRLE